MSECLNPLNYLAFSFDSCRFRAFSLCSSQQETPKGAISVSDMYGEKIDVSVNATICLSPETYEAI